MCVWTQGARHWDELIGTVFETCLSKIRDGVVKFWGPRVVQGKLHVLYETARYQYLAAGVLWDRLS